MNNISRESRSASNCFHNYMLTLIWSCILALAYFTMPAASASFGNVSLQYSTNVTTDPAVVNITMVSEVYPVKVQTRPAVVEDTFTFIYQTQSSSQFFVKSFDSNGALVTSFAIQSNASKLAMNFDKKIAGLVDPDMGIQCFVYIPTTSGTVVTYIIAGTSSAPCSAVTYTEGAYFVWTTATTIFKSLPALAVENEVALNAGGSAVTNLLHMAYGDRVLLTYAGYASVHILAVVDFAVMSTKTVNVVAYDQMLVDNVGKNELVFFVNSGTIIFYNVNTWSVATTKYAELSVVGLDVNFGTLAIENCGPYQYLLVMPRQGTSSSFLIVDKITTANFAFSLSDPLYLNNGFQAPIRLNSANELVFSVHRFDTTYAYFGLFRLPVVEPCTAILISYRCKFCIYRDLTAGMPLLANDTTTKCVKPAEFPSTYGFDSNYGVLVPPPPTIPTTPNTTTPNTTTPNTTTPNTTTPIPTTPNTTTPNTTTPQSVYSNQSISLTSTFKSTSSAVLVRFDQYIEVTSAWQAYLHFVFTDLSTNVTSVNQSLFKLTPASNGLDIIIDVPISTDQGMLNISLVSSVNGTDNETSNIIPAKAFPIVIYDIVLFNEPDQVKARAAASAAMGAASSQRTVANFMLMNSQVHLAVGLDRLFCDYTYLAFLGQKWTRLPYTRLLLDPSLEVSLVPFSSPPDPKEKTFKYTGIRAFGHNPACKPASQFVFNDIDCGFFANYGSDYITLIVSLAVNVAFFGLYLYMEKKGWHPVELTEEQNAKNQLALERKKWEDPKYEAPKEPLPNKLKNIGVGVISNLTKVFGLQYFLVKMHANSLKLLLYTFLQMYYMRNTWQSWINLVVAIINVVFYIFYFYLLWKFLNNLLSSTQQLDKSKRKRKYTSGQKTEIFKVVPLGEIKLAAVGKIWDKLKADGDKLAFVYPFIVLTRNILLAAALVFLSEAGIAAPVVCIVIELAYFVYLAISRVKANFVENYMEMFITLCYVCYCIMTCLTYRDDIDMARLDKGMFVMLLMTTGGTIFFGLYGICILVYDILTPMLCSETFAGERYIENSNLLKSKLPLKYQELRGNVKKDIGEAEKILCARMAKENLNEEGLELPEDKAIPFKSKAVVVKKPTADHSFHKARPDDSQDNNQ